MRVTDKDYKNIIDFCQVQRLVRDVADEFHFDMPFITQLLGRMVKQGFLNAEQMPFNGQYKNKYKSLPQAYELLEERKQETIAREQRRLEREMTKEEREPLKKVKEYTVAEATKQIAVGHIRVNGFDGFRGGSGKQERPKVYVSGSTLA